MRLPELNEAEWALLVVAVGDYLHRRTRHPNMPSNLKSNVTIEEHAALMATGKALTYKIRGPDQEPAWMQPDSGSSRSGVSPIE